MKCAHCHALNIATDSVCFSCGGSMRGSWDPNSPNIIGAPGWGFIFATLCGIIPILTIGGCVPVLIGVASASVCLMLARAVHFPLWVRVSACLVVTSIAWICVGSLILATMRMGE